MSKPHSCDAKTNVKIIQHADDGGDDDDDDGDDVDGGDDDDDGGDGDAWVSDLK